uniref:Style-specific protein n=1 Tax=Steinernema glaseri TaxID=37863 RepID=A0A1I8A004_9BILA
MATYLIVFAVLFVFWVCYEVHHGRKSRGEPGVPLIGILFDSVTFTVREEFEDDDASTSEKRRRKKGSKHSRKKRSHRHRHNRSHRHRHSAKKSDSNTSEPGSDAEKKVNKV